MLHLGRKKKVLRIHVDTVHEEAQAFDTMYYETWRHLTTRAKADKLQLSAIGRCVRFTSLPIVRRAEKEE